MTKRFRVSWGMCFFLLAFPSIMFAQTLNWHSDALIENNAGFNGFSPQVAMSGLNVVAVWRQLDDQETLRIYSNYGIFGQAALTSTPVPTMTEWGMIIVVILLGIGSAYYLKKRRVV
jgi:hypothetical protein